MENRFRRLELAGIAFSLAIAVFAPLRAGAQAGDHPITIDVVVEDNLGHPVSGLQAEDFKVLDNGQPAKIQSFKSMESKGGKDDPVHVLIVFDMINSAFDTVAREREQLNEFLSQDGGQLSHPVSLGLLSDQGIKITPGSTLDGKVLLADFDKVETAEQTVGHTTGFYGEADRLQKSLDQLGQLALYETNLPGRKMVLVVSPGWPLLSRAGDDADLKQRTSVFSSIVALSKQLREARVALYCIDPNWLGRSDPIFYKNYLKPVKAPKQAEYGDLGLQILADHTGGRNLINGRDILGDFNAAFRDAGPYYELTLDAAAGNPNEYHELRVSTVKPDAKVLTTAGYYTAGDQTVMASGKNSK